MTLSGVKRTRCQILEGADLRMHMRHSYGVERVRQQRSILLTMIL